MTASELLIALREKGITIRPNGDALHVDAPKGAMTLPIVEALKKHKAVILAVARTLGDRESDADWEIVQDWLLDSTAKTFTKPMQAAAQRIYVPVNAEEWPESYARRLRDALRVRALLRVFGEITPDIEQESSQVETA